jgi:hypothetical protein
MGGQQNSKLANEERTRHVQLGVRNILKKFCDVLQPTDSELVALYYNVLDSTLGPADEHSKIAKGKVEKKQIEYLDRMQLPLFRLFKHEDKSIGRIRANHARKGTCCTDFDSKKFAQQLTLLEHEIFKSIHETELLNKAWSSAKKAELAPNLVSMAELFNRISGWVVGEIIQAPDKDARVTRLRWMLDVAKQLRDLNNLNGTMEIMSGLSNSAIHRLTATWNQLWTAERTAAEGSHARFNLSRSSAPASVQPPNPFHRPVPPTHARTHSHLPEARILLRLGSGRPPAFRAEEALLVGKEFRELTIISEESSTSVRSLSWSVPNRPHIH